MKCRWISVGNRWELKVLEDDEETGFKTMASVVYNSSYKWEVTLTPYLSVIEVGGTRDEVFAWAERVLRYKDYDIVVVKDGGYS